MCIQCRAPFTNSRPLDEEGRCLACRLGARGYDAAYTYGEYQGVLRKLIHLFKYGRILPLERIFIDQMLVALPRDEEFDLVTAVPLHWTRFWWRGFNQSARLARGLSTRLGAPYRQLVRRRRSTGAQANLSGAARRRNVQGAFRVPDNSAIRDQRVLLIDDVFTTGSTVEACARALKRAGARRVVVLTLARVDRRAWMEPYPKARLTAAASVRNN